MNKVYCTLSSAFHLNWCRKTSGVKEIENAIEFKTSKLKNNFNAREPKWLQSKPMFSTRFFNAIQNIIPIRLIFCVPSYTHSYTYSYNSSQLFKLGS